MINVAAWNGRLWNVSIADLQSHGVSFCILVFHLSQVNWLKAETATAAEAILAWKQTRTRPFHSEPWSKTIPFEHLWIENRYLFLGVFFGKFPVTKNEWKIISNIASFEMQTCST